MDSPSFNEQVIQSVIKSLDTRFGASLTQVLFWKFQENTKLRISDIPLKPDLFIECVRNVFGAGSGAIERTLTEGISHDFSINLHGEMDFVKAVQVARSSKLKGDLTDSRHYK